MTNERIKCENYTQFRQELCEYLRNPSNEFDLILQVSLLGLKRSIKGSFEHSVKVYSRDVFDVLKRFRNAQKMRDELPSPNTMISVFDRLKYAQLLEDTICWEEKTDELITQYDNGKI